MPWGAVADAMNGLLGDVGRSQFKQVKRKNRCSNVGKGELRSYGGKRATRPVVTDRS